MVVLLLMLFNGFMLFVGFYMVMASLHTVTNYQLFLLAAACLLLVGGLAFLFHSPVGQFLLRWMSGGRKPIAREEATLHPVIERVQQGIEEKLGLSVLPIKLRVLDAPMPNAFAVGRDTLIVSRALYETATEDELAGVIAHEFAHLHHGDSNRLGMALGVSVVSLALAWVAGMFVAILNGVGRAFTSAHEAGWVVGLVTLVFSVVTVFFVLLVQLGNWVLRVIMLLAGRRQEYKSDQFAIDAGFGAGLLSYLDKIKNMHFDSPRGLLGRLYATHPPTMLRIGKVEKAIQSSVF